MGPCTPTGDMRAPPTQLYRCWCGELIRHARSTEREWAYVSVLTGEILVDNAPSEYREDPKGWWDRLAREDIGRYSNLKAAFDLGGQSWLHFHQARHSEPELLIPWDARMPPECHAQPMYAAPHGWECRVMRSRFPYVRHESYTRREARR